MRRAAATLPALLLLAPALGLTGCQTKSCSSLHGSQVVALAERPHPLTPTNNTDPCG